VVRLVHPWGGPRTGRRGDDEPDRLELFDQATARRASSSAGPLAAPHAGQANERCKTAGSTNAAIRMSVAPRPGGDAAAATDEVPPETHHGHGPARIGGSGNPGHPATVGIREHRAEAVRWALARIRDRPAYAQLRERKRIRSSTSSKPDLTGSGRPEDAGPAVPGRARERVRRRKPSQAGGRRQTYRRGGVAPSTRGPATSCTPCRHERGRSRASRWPAPCILSEGPRRRSLDQPVGVEQKQPGAGASGGARW